MLDNFFFGNSRSASALNSSTFSVQRCIAQMVLLAGPGVLISTFALGAALKVGCYYWGLIHFFMSFWTEDP